MQAGWPPPRLTSVVNQQVHNAAPQVEKHPYVLAARVQQEYSEVQKEMVRTYNSMRAKLLESGLMEEKL